MGATRTVTDEQVEAAARVLYESERVEPWDGAPVDEQEPYLRMARKMLEAAARIAATSGG